MSPATTAVTSSGTDPAEHGAQLADVLRSGRFAATAEIGPPRGADATSISRKAQLLRGWVDAANVTDNQGANMRMSSLGGCVLAMRSGVEPVMQLTCRDRNRLALQSDLLSAGALGIPNVLLLTGDHTRHGDHPDAKPVFDLDGPQLVWAARTLRDDGRTTAGTTITGRPRWLVGSVENPFAPPTALRARRLAKKVAAGAEFVQTQYVFDLDVFERWMTQVRELGLTEHCRIVAGVGPIRSLRVLDLLSDRIPGVHVPATVGRRLRGVPPSRVAAEGVDLCVETIRRLRGIPGVSGVHLMAFGYEHGISEILSRAGVGPQARAEEDRASGAAALATIPSTAGTTI